MKRFALFVPNFILMLFIFLMILSQSAFAETYYVDTAGTDRYGCGFEGYGADACATPQYVINTYSPGRGDTIHMDNGTYTEHGRSGYVIKIEGSISGSSGYLTIKARNDNQAVLDLETTSGSGYCTKVLDTEHVKFEGINFTRCGLSGARLASSGSSGPSNDIWFDKCKFYNIGRGYSGQAHGGINFSGLTGVNKSTGSSSPIKVTKSEFYNIGRKDPERDDGYDHAIYATGSFYIENSVFRDHYAGYHLKLNGGRYHIYNNTIAEQHDSGISGGAIYFSGVSSAVIANNAFTDIKKDSYIGRGGGCDSTSDAAKISWYNNISDVNISGAGYCQSVSSNWAGNSGNKHGKTQAALGFTNPGENDYSIASNSVLIDQGNTIYSPSDDIIGTSRPQGAAADVGAYEKVSGSSSVKKSPKPPKGLKIID